MTHPAAVVVGSGIPRPITSLWFRTYGEAITILVKGTDTIKLNRRQFYLDVGHLSSKCLVLLRRTEQPGRATFLQSQLTCCITMNVTHYDERRTDTVVSAEVVMIRLRHRNTRIAACRISKTFPKGRFPISNLRYFTVATSTRIKLVGLRLSREPKPASRSGIRNLATQLTSSAKVILRTILKCPMEYGCSVRQGVPSRSFDAREVNASQFIASRNVTARV